MTQNSSSDPSGTKLTKSAPGEPRSTDEAALLGRASSFSLDVELRSLGQGLRDYVNKLRSGEPGALPSVLGLIVLGIIFSQVSSQFLSKSNIGNLPGQGAYIAIIALGLVFVLLLGEIDLSAGTAGGLCAAFAAQALVRGGLRGGIPGSSALFYILVAAMILAVGLGLWMKNYIGVALVVVGIVIVLTKLDQHVFAALLFTVCLGSAIGIITGFLVAKVGIPSFIVTLAMFIAWQGVILFALNNNPIGIGNYDLWYKLGHGNMSVFWSWVFGIVVGAGYLLFTLFRSWSAQRRNLSADAYGLVLARGGVILVAALVVTYFANQNRNQNPNFEIKGIPWAASVPVALMILCTLVLTKTTWGRHLFATGGNTEAARRAGIDVVHVKMSAFIACSSFGALGGLFLTTSQNSASLDLGSSNVLLFSVAAAVIGGTSLFGGRGRARDAILGALVIVIIPNGILLKQNLPAAYQQVITGAVLLIAAAVDALSRRRSVRR